VSDAVPPVCYFHIRYVSLYIILPPILGLPSDLVSAGDHSYTYEYLPCYCLAYGVRVQTRLFFAL